METFGYGSFILSLLHLFTWGPTVCQPWWCKGLSTRGSQHGMVWHPYQRLWNRLGGVFLSAKMIEGRALLTYWVRTRVAEQSTIRRQSCVTKNWPTPSANTLGEKNRTGQLMQTMSGRDGEKGRDSCFLAAAQHHHAEIQGYWIAQIFRQSQRCRWWCKISWFLKNTARAKQNTSVGQIWPSGCQFATLS